MFVAKKGSDWKLNERARLFRRDAAAIPTHGRRGRGEFMARREVWSAKLTSVVVVDNRDRENHEISNEETSLSVSKKGQKQLFTFDSVFEDGQEERLGPLIVDKSLRLVRMGFHSSILITGVANQRVEAFVVERQLQRLFEAFEDEGESLATGDIVLSYNVDVSCAETFADRVVDLTISSTSASSSNSSSSSSSSSGLKIINGKVANLNKASCKTAASALSTVRGALRKRSILVATRADAGGGAPNALSSRLIGAVGHVILTLGVSQSVLSVADGQVPFRLAPGLAHPLPFSPRLWSRIPLSGARAPVHVGDCVAGRRRGAQLQACQGEGCGTSHGWTAVDGD